MMRSGMSAVSDMGGMGMASSILQSGDLGQLGGSNSGIAATNAVGTNFRDQWGKRVSVYGSYSYSHKNNSLLQNTAAQNFYANNSFLNHQDQNNQTIGDSHRGTFNLEYQIDSFNYIKISPSINYSKNIGNNKSWFDYIQTGGIKSSDGSNVNQSVSTAPNLSANILFNHKFRKRGRNFSASVNLGNSESNSTQDIVNLSNQYIPPFIGYRNAFQYIDQQNNNHSYGLRLTYSEPLSKTRNLDFSLSHNNNYSRNDKKTFNVDSASKVQTLNSLLSNDFENNFYNNRAGISLRTTTKKYNYTLGLSFQPVDLQGKSITKDSAYKPIKRLNVFPILRAVYNFSRTKALNFNYSGNATQPSFTQLQPVLDVSNQQNITQGNPYLKPSINHNLNFSYNNFNFITGKVFFSNFTFSTIKNQIINNNINKGAGRQLSIPENVNGYYNLLGLYTYSRPYKNRKYVITFNGSANYNHNINLIDSNKNIGQNWIVNQGFNF
jgi:hypothetical protein